MYSRLGHFGGLQTYTLEQLKKVPLVPNSGICTFIFVSSLTEIAKAPSMFLQSSLHLVPHSHRRRIELEDNAEVVVASDWGTESLPC